jgi:hypothetical protein
MQTATELIQNDNLEKVVKNTVHIPGRHLFSFYNMTSKMAMAIEREILEHIKKPFYSKKREHYVEMINELKRLFLVRQLLIENIVVTAGRSVIAERLANDTTYTGIINYGILGTGVTTPVNGNTQLGTEVFRKVVASQSTTDAASFIDFFISKADWAGTATEFGTVIDGTASANTGQLFTHALTGGWTKTSSESMTIACEYDIT